MIPRLAEYNGITIDYSRDSLIPPQGLAMLTGKGFYKKDHEDSPQESFARAATCYCFGDYEFAQRIYDYVSLQWFTFASPVLSNAVDVKWPDAKGDDLFQSMAIWLKDNVTPEGMPISCFLNAISDSKESLVDNRTETAWLSVMGGGVGIYAGNRSPDEKSTGIMRHLRGYDADTLAYRQTSTRRGSMCAYADINHPEINNFMDMRNPVGGESSLKCFNLNNGVNVNDEFYEAVISGDDIELIDPKHGPTGRFQSAREVWEKLMDMRYTTGEPFINNIDTVNRNIPKWITKPTYKVLQSNLCTEITLMTSKKRTAVCCLSSLNLEKRDEWKDTQIVQDLVRLLDNVIEYFIQLAPPVLSRAIHSAKQERAIGIGTLGFHSYLQSKSIAFESGGFNSAAQVNHNIYRSIKKAAIEGSKQLATERGECEDCLGSGMRNSHLLAIAPNASSSSLVNVSPSIEPFAANAFNAQGRAGSFLITNKWLKIVLQGHDKDDQATWNSIINNKGSVQHLDFLSDHDKLVFKTSYEIEQRWIIEHAAGRQPEICQAQSVNVFMRLGTTKQYMSDLHLLAWKLGVKSLYYCRAEAPTTASVTSGPIMDTVNKKPNKIEFNECFACEG